MNRRGRVGPRLVGSPIAAMILLVGSRLPLTRTGLGSSVPSIEAASIVSSSLTASLQWGARLFVIILGAGLVLGPTAAINRRWAVVVWWTLSVLSLVGGAAMVALLARNSGGAVVAIAAAGFVLVASGALEFWWRRGTSATAQPEPAGARSG